MGPDALRTGAALVAAVFCLSAVAGCSAKDEGDEDPTVDGAEVSWTEPKDGEPKALLMLIHGGGWKASDDAYEQEKMNAEGLTEDGYATVAIGYDEGARGFEQIQAVYDEARDRYPDIPVCATGTSAGGHLGLMLATREPGLDCVLAIAAPTDLTTIGAQDPQGQETYTGALDVFGQDKLEEFSPALYADRIRADVLLVAAESDPLVPAAQSRELAKVLPGVDLLVLPAGPVPAPFAHYGGVQGDAQGVLLGREFAFLDRVTRNG